MKTNTFMNGSSGYVPWYYNYLNDLSGIILILNQEMQEPFQKLLLGNLTQNAVQAGFVSFDRIHVEIIEPLLIADHDLVNLCLSTTNDDFGLNSEQRLNMFYFKKTHCCYISGGLHSQCQERLWHLQAF